jgi:hypothetical protein
MDYSRVYSEFIADRRTREGSLTVFDRHHILPTCLGGGNEPENLIRLSPSDHLFAHVLLGRIHGGKLAVVAVRMAGMRKYRGRRTRERFDKLRAEARRAQSRPMSEETKRKLSLKNKGRERTPSQKAQMATSAKRRTDDPAWRTRQSSLMRGNQHRLGLSPSQETRDKISASLKARNQRSD